MFVRLQLSAFTYTLVLSQATLETTRCQTQQNPEYQLCPLHWKTDYSFRPKDVTQITSEFQAKRTSSQTRNSTLKVFMLISRCRWRVVCLPWPETSAVWGKTVSYYSACSFFPHAIASISLKHFKIVKYTLLQTHCLVPQIYQDTI